MNHATDSNESKTDALFVSDLHLATARPEKIKLFTDLLHGLTAAKMTRLYILGDLFDAFLGDEDQREPIPTVFSALSEANRRGLTVFFICGNREFELGPFSQARSGMARLPDPAEVEINGQKLLLSHGDLLCTDDRAYIRYRHFITHPAVFAIMRHLPYRWRYALSDNHRKKDAAHYRQPVDVNAKAVTDIIGRYGVSVLIHGHTHRQGEHELTVNGRTARRFVLGDWYESDCVLALGSGRFRFHRVRDYLADIRCSNN